MSYSIDTSALLDGWVRYYPPDVFAVVWEQIDALIAAGTLLASEEVLRELEKKEDDLFDWVSARKSMFVPTDASVQPAVTNLLQRHPNFVDVTTGRSAADPFVIAVAQVRGLTVVTAEKSKPTKPRIPDVCRAEGIRCISLLEMFRELGWRFGGSR